MKCPSCGRDSTGSADVCQSCGSILSIPLPLRPGEKAEVLAILIQNQNSITWTAFSIAMTIEGILVAAIFQIPNGQKAISLVGFLLAIAFTFLVGWSHHETSLLFREATQCFPTTFHRPSTLVSVMLILVFGGWILAWIYLMIWWVTW